MLINVFFLCKVSKILINNLIICATSDKLLYYNEYDSSNKGCHILLKVPGDKHFPCGTPGVIAFINSLQMETIACTNKALQAPQLVICHSGGGGGGWWLVSWGEIWSDITSRRQKKLHGPMSVDSITVHILFLTRIIWLITKTVSKLNNTSYSQAESRGD